MWNEEKRFLDAQLAPGELLLWSGQPRQGVFLHSSDALFIPFSLLWAGFAVFWEYMVIRAGGPFFFALWGVPFILVGLYITVGRFFVDAKQRGRTYYGVTNERVVIVSGLFGRKVRSLDLKALADVTLEERGDGGGTITFGVPNPNPMPWPSYRATVPRWGQQPTVPSLELASEARRVYDIIRHARQQKGAA